MIFWPPFCFSWEHIDIHIHTYFYTHTHIYMRLSHVFVKFSFIVVVEDWIAYTNREGTLNCWDWMPSWVLLIALGVLRRQSCYILLLSFLSFIDIIVLIDITSSSTSVILFYFSFYSCVLEGSFSLFSLYGVVLPRRLVGGSF